MFVAERKAVLLARLHDEGRVVARELADESGSRRTASVATCEISPPLASASGFTAAQFPSLAPWSTIARAVPSSREQATDRRPRRPADQAR